MRDKLRNQIFTQLQPRYPTQLYPAAIGTLKSRIIFRLSSKSIKQAITVANVTVANVTETIDEVNWHAMQQPLIPVRTSLSLPR